MLAAVVLRRGVFLSPNTLNSLNLSRSLAYKSSARSKKAREKDIRRQAYRGPPRTTPKPTKTIPGVPRVDQPDKPRKDNLWDTILSLRNFGKDRQVTRDIWDKYPEPSYWTLTRVKGPVDGHRPRAWGVLTFRGECTQRVQQIRRPYKRGWKLYYYKPWTSERLPRAEYLKKKAEEKKAAEAKVSEAKASESASTDGSSESSESSSSDSSESESSDSEDEKVKTSVNI